VQADVERFLTLVRRELGADDARLATADEAAPEEMPIQIRAFLADGRAVVVRFAQPPPDLEAKQRRLEMLAGTFDTLLEEPPHTQARKSRPPVASSLHDELSALCARAVSVNAIVIDANSPVVWGAAYTEGVTPQAPLASSPRVTESPANDGGSSPGFSGPLTAAGLQAAPAEGELEARRTNLSKRALHVVRGLPELAALRKGRHLRHVDREGDAPLIAHSFAGIYVLVVVFEAAFDELRAERAILEAMPRVERLVLALPPLDTPPSTGAGVIALRRPRRR
jgi:hypothetical protein